MRKILYTVVGIALAAGGAALAVELREREDAARLADEAQGLLAAPFERAPELDQLAAARAIQLLEEALSLHDAKRTRGLHAWAEALAALQKRELSRAAQALRRARALLPAQADLDVLGAALAARHGDRDAAEAQLRAAFEKDRDHARARMLAADLLADAGQHERALELLTALCAQHASVGTLWNRRGLAHEALDDAASARADFERAAALDPRLPQPYVNLGRLHRAAGRAPDAEAAFARALERDPEHAEAWLGRGLARIAQGDLAGGQLDLERARDLAPAQPAPLVALADLDAQAGRSEQALTRYRAALALAKDNAVVWLKLGNALVRTGELAEARAAFERAIELQPNMSAAHNGLGAALMGQGDHDAAERAFATAAELDASDPNPLRNLALLAARRTP